MRLEQSYADHLKFLIQKVLPDARVYLFGSRADDTKKGGDIDILIIAKRRLTFSEGSQIRVGFMTEFGEQKIDLVSFSENEQDPFKDLALDGAIEL